MGAIFRAKEGVRKIMYSSISNKPKSAYHFPPGQSHESPCMDPYFRSAEYQSKREQWMRDAGILKE